MPSMVQYPEIRDFHILDVSQNATKAQNSQISDTLYSSWPAETMQAVNQLGQVVTGSVLESLELVSPNENASGMVYGDLMMGSASARPLTPSMSSQESIISEQAELTEMKPVPIALVPTHIPPVPKPVY